MKNIVVICQDTKEFETLNKHYNKDYDTPTTSDSWPFGFRVSDTYDVGYSRLAYYQEHRLYSTYKYVSFVEWIQLTNPKPTTKSESNMKYVVEVSNHEEANAVRKNAGKSYLNSIQTFPWGVNGVSGHMSDIGFYSLNTSEYGPVIKFKDWALMFGIKLKPNKTLKLTSDYNAEVDYNAQVVRVGCQSIPFSVVEELVKLVKE